jgi:hypothetical protein
MALVMFIATWGCAVQLMQFFREERWLLVGLSVAVLVASIMVILEAISVFSNLKREKEATANS